MTSGEAWSPDPLALDRWLDGEASPEESAGIEARLAGDPAARARIQGRRHLLATLARAAQAGDPADLGPLTARVRAALAEDRDAALRSLSLGNRRQTLRWTWGAAAAAVLVVALALSALSPVVRNADAMPREALMAADLVRNSPATGGAVAACGVQEPTSPFRFPLVERREMGVKGCVDPDLESGERAILYRIADLDVVGYVAVPDVGAKRGPEIGVTRLTDVVVFDVRLGGAAYYLAVRREKVDRHGMCAACHGRSRDGDKNPHYFQERRIPFRP